MTSTSEHIEDIMHMAEFLTMKDIISEGGPKMFATTAKRRRSDLLDAIRTSSSLQEVVQEAFTHKQQRQLDERDTRLKRARLDMNISNTSTAEEDLFLQDPEEIVKLQALARFIDRTNNYNTRQAICLSCAQEDFAHEMNYIFLDQIPNAYLLTPIFRHPAQHLVSGMLLYEPALTFSEDRRGGPICTDCLEDLQIGNIPLFSLVNGLWNGPVPDELGILNLPERLLIGLYFPAVYIIKLYPQRKGANHWDTSALNSGVRGNVSTYQLNTPDITAMIDGNLLPHRPTLLATTIGITIIGPKNLPVKSLAPFLSVNRLRVRNALLFLQKHNHLYRHIVISEENLRLLPENGLPSELLAIIKHSDEQDMLTEEHEGYIVDDLDVDENGMLTVYDLSVS